MEEMKCEVCKKYFEAETKNKICNECKFKISQMSTDIQYKDRIKILKDQYRQDNRCVMDMNDFVIKSNVTGQKDTIKVDEFYTTISEALTEGKLISIAFDKKTFKSKHRNVGSSDGEDEDRGLVAKHGYAVVGAKKKMV